VMVTGDQGATARAVADQIGLNGPGEIRILDAADLEHLSGPDLAAAAREAHAFTRMSPAQKLRIVQTLQESGVVVAMVGDGVNDSPALRASDIGIALRQDGAAAAREVADIFLDTDDLNTLTLALARSRTIHTNIRKAIHYLLGTNASEILLMLAATGLGAQAALTPLELLWINLISDVLPGIGLALDPPEAGVLEQPPRPANEAIVRPEDVGPLTRHAALLTGGAFAAGAVGVLRYGLDSPQARTMTFASLVTAQLLHALTCRSTTQSLFGADRPPPNPVLSKILVGSALAQSATLLVPGIRKLLGLAPIGAADLAVTLAGGVLPFVAAETLKPREEAPGSGTLLYFSRPAGTHRACEAVRAASLMTSWP
jgi:P-type Ca2+ transporter type 2C